MSVLRTTTLHRSRRPVIRGTAVTVLLALLVSIVPRPGDVAATMTETSLTLAQADFTAGTFNNTEFSGSALRLVQTSPGQYAASGSWTSPAYDTGGTSLWGWFSGQGDSSLVTNHQPNGSFETDIAPADGVPDGWNLNPAVAIRTTEYPTSGAYSLRLDPPNLPSGGVYHLYGPPTAALSNGTYHLVAHVRGDVSESGFGMMFATYDLDTSTRTGAIIPYGRDFGVGSHLPDGTILHYTFSVSLPAGSEALQVDLAMGGRGPIWIDDLILFETSPFALETQTSDDGSSWSAWEAPRPFLDNRIAVGSPASRYIRFRVTLTTTDTSRTPTASSFQLTLARAFPFSIGYGGVMRKFFTPTWEPAGSHGAVRVGEGGSLEFADGSPAKFWATQIGGNASSDPEACAMAEAYGFNLLKTQLVHDYNEDILTPSVIDGFDRLIDDCKDRGVYLSLRFFNAYRIINDPFLPDHAKYVTTGMGSEYYFDSQLVDSMKQYATDVLSHTNPYTGLTIGADPAVVSIEYLNEFGMVQAFFADRLHAECLSLPACSFPRDIGPAHVTMLNDQWNAWLRGRYANRSALETAWQQSGKTGLQATEDPWDGNGTVARLKYGVKDTYSRARFRDTVAFYLSVEENYYATMQAHIGTLRTALGSVPLTIGTQALRGPSRAGVAGLLPTDIIDIHAYVDHPKSDLGLDRVSQIADPSTIVLAWASKSRVLGKPYTVSEYNQYGYTDFTAEMPILGSAYAAFQRFDSVTNFIFADTLDGDLFIDNFDPVRLAQLPVAANLFLRDVTGAQTTVPLTYTTAETQEVDTPQFGLVGWRSDGILSSEYALLRGIGVQSFAAPATQPPATVIADNALPSNPATPYVSDTGQLALDTIAKTFTIQTLGTQGIIGALAGTETAMPNLTITVPETGVEQASIFLTAIDTANLGTASSLLLTAVTKSEPVGQRWNIDKRQRLAAGALPVLTVGVTATVTLPTSKSVRVFALDEQGQRKAEVPVTSDPTTSRFTIDGSYQAVWYEVTAVGDTTPPAGVTNLREQ